MKTRTVTFFALAALLLCLFTACGSKDSVISTDQAQKIALEDAGLSAKDVDDVHTHVVDYENYPRYSVHITVGETEYEYVIDVVTGEILSANELE